MMNKNLYCSLLLTACISISPAFLRASAEGTPATFTIQNGASPWSDRLNVWQLSDVPASVDGSGPLPQQICGSRQITVPDGTKYLLLGVCNQDIGKFKTDYPGAKSTGESMSVAHPDGSEKIPYTIFRMEGPAATVGDKTFIAGLILLQLNDKTGASSPPAVAPASVAPVVPPKPKSFQPPQDPFDIGSDKTKLHIYVLMGQSNMVGRDTTGLETQTTDPRIGYFDGRNWIIAIEPMKGGSGIGPSISFARTLLPAYPDGKIGLVPCAVGGTPLSRWIKGADLYEYALKRAKQAAESGVIEGILWHQGESDSDTPEHATTYEVRLTQMFRDFREDLGQPNLPIVVGELGEFVQIPQVQVVKAALRNMPNDLPHVGLADSNDLTDKGDHLHFNAASQAEFGQRYADAMQKLQQASAAK